MSSASSIDEISLSGVSFPLCIEGRTRISQRCDGNRAKNRVATKKSRVLRTDVVAPRVNGSRRGIKYRAR